MGDAERFIHGLVAIAPGLSAILREHLKADDELLPHVWMGDFSRHLLALDEHVRAGVADEATLVALLAYLDQQMGTGPEEVRELISVSFVENVAVEAAADPALRARFGPSLAAELDVILRGWGLAPREAGQTSVWVFNAAGAHFPGAVFSSPVWAEAWIAKHSLTGVLTAYPVDQGVYEWAVAGGRFRPKRAPEPGEAGRFSSAYQEHYHYEDGVRVA
jgi:hypothetical protein